MSGSYPLETQCALAGGGWRLISCLAGGISGRRDHPGPGQLGNRLHHSNCCLRHCAGMVYSRHTLLLLPAPRRLAIGTNLKGAEGT